MSRRFRTALSLLTLALVAAACSSTSASITSPSASTSLAGAWTGTASDSSTPTVGHGGMMGQAGMGTMQWHLTQNGPNVTGTTGFSGMGSMMRGTLSGTMSVNVLTFQMHLPGSMMSGACAANANGTAHMDWATMTMTGNYTGTHSCAGPFQDGHMTLTRR